MKRVKIELLVKLPDDFDESEVDGAIADTLFDLGAEVVDSKEYKEIPLEENQDDC